MTGSITGTSNVWPNYARGNTDGSKASNQLGKDDFLKILLTQLKNQDPTQPLKDTDFIAQMAQFSSMEQITNMALEMKNLSQSMGIASSIIGKSVSWLEKGPIESIARNGIVDGISLKDGVQYALVQGDEIPINDLIKVSNANTEATP
ncbi:MAG TPA: flagellar hook capping FlgD N-terminal domain-containing protein [Bacilli bacterium]